MLGANDSFVVGMTEGDRVFASYLDSQGLPYDFEQPVAGTTKRPDFRIVLNGESSLFEVKQFDSSPEDDRGGFGHFDMYGPLREKINAAGKKFKGLKGTAPCSLVLYNNGKPFVFLGASQVYGAMLGDVSATFPIDPKTGRGDASQLKWEFRRGGKMRWYKPGTNETLRAINTTISSIIVIDTIDIGQRRFGIAARRRESELEQDLSAEELEARRDADPGIRETARRIRVFENLARSKPLSEAFGRGPWDERWGRDGDHLGRLFIGAEVKKLEAEEAEAGIRYEPWNGVTMHQSQAFKAKLRTNSDATPS